MLLSKYFSVWVLTARRAFQIIRGEYEEMKRLIVAFAAVMALGLLVLLPVWAGAKEEAAARAPLEDYFKGQATGDPAYIKKAFHPDGKIVFVREGKLVQLTRDEFASRFTGKPAPDEAQRKRTIESVDIAGNAAIARIVLDYPAVRVTDYMSLIKVDGEWKIINKTFYAEPKQK
jgi:hypothetical protein